MLLKDKRIGATVALAILTEYIICNLILKNAIARPRPFWTDETLSIIIKEPTDFSFPSGHSSVWFALASGVLYRNRQWGIAAMIVAVFVAFSRLYLTVHFPTDVLVGAAIGVVMAIISGKIVDFINTKYSLENRFGIK